MLIQRAAYVREIYVNSTLSSNMLRNKNTDFLEKNMFKLHDTYDY